MTPPVYLNLLAVQIGWLAVFTFLKLPINGRELTLNRIASGRFFLKLSR